MDIQKTKKNSFCVIGKEGSTIEGHGFIQKLWQNANDNFSQIKDLAKRDENGNVLGMWGVMSDMSHSFMPWEENFSKGLYLAGIECDKDAQAPDGWVKWIIPGYEYIYVECTTQNTFLDVIQYMKEHDIPLVGAAHDFTCPTTKKSYMFFPIEKL